MSSGPVGRRSDPCGLGCPSGPGSTPGNTTDTQCFAYDGNRRLKETWTDTAGTTTLPAPSVPGVGGCVTQTPTKNTVGGPDPYWQSFDYDVVGNRTKLVDHDVIDDPAKNVTTEYGYRPGAQAGDRTHRLDAVTVKNGTAAPVTTNVTYDQAGNTKTRPGTGANPQALTWDEEDKLTTVASATGTSEYVYDADGNRIIRRQNGKSTLYLETDELTTNTDGSGPVVGTRYYPTAGGATVVRNGSGAITFMATDHHGTPNSILDAAGLTATRRQSKPFGEPRGTQPTQANGQWPDDKGFLGKPMDTTGLTHVGAREYDPGLGRFISVDPIMDLADAQQMHGYTYSSNNPTTVSDPTGLAEYDPYTPYKGGSGGAGVTNPPTSNRPPVYCGNVMSCGDSGVDQTTTSPTAPGGTAGCVNYCMRPPTKPGTGNKGNGVPGGGKNSQFTGPRTVPQTPQQVSWCGICLVSKPAPAMTPAENRGPDPLILEWTPDCGIDSPLLNAGCSSSGALMTGGGMAVSIPKGMIQDVYTVAPDGTRVRAPGLPWLVKTGKITLWGGVATSGVSNFVANIGMG
ncbi:RHS repeat domain-containing protein [Embleya sp. NPDC001921]